MHGLSQLTAAEQTVTAAGRTYRLAPLTLSDYGEIENRILARRPDPLAVALQALDGLDEKQQESLLGRAYDRAVSARLMTAAEFQKWRETPDGLCYRFWLMARKAQPGLTLEEAAEAVGQLLDEDETLLRRRIDDCSGPPVGNSPGRAQPPATQTPMPPCRGTAGPAS